MPPTLLSRSRRRALFSLFAIAFVGGDCSHPADRPATFERNFDSCSRAFLFLSPNTDENLTQNEAVRRMQGAVHAKFHHLAEELLDRTAMGSACVADALGDWSDGLENSLLVDVASAPDWPSLRYVAAVFGLQARQKSVLVFRADVAGQDEVAVLDIPGLDLVALRRRLDQGGIAFRTIVPTLRGHRIVVLDVGRRWHGCVVRLAQDLGVAVEFTGGQSVSLGAGTRTDAQSQFVSVITGPTANRDQ